LAAIKEGVPVVVHTFHGHVFHSYFNKYKTQLFVNIEKYLARKSDKIITISQLQDNEITNILNLDKTKTKVIPIGIDIEKFRKNKEEKRFLFRKKYGIKDDEIAIGIIGRIVPVKNHNMFVKSFSLLKKSLEGFNKVKAFVIGDGELRAETIDLARKLGLKVWQKGVELFDADIYFTSWIKEVENVYSGLDIVALTSLNEGTPIMLIEAQAAGVPVVATNVGGVADTFVNGITGILSPPKDVYSFYYNMAQLVIDRKLRIGMGVKGYNFVKNKFDYPILVENMRNLYFSLLDKKVPSYMLIKQVYNTGSREMASVS